MTTQPILALIVFAFAILCAPVALAATTLALLKGTWGGTDIDTSPKIRVTIKLSGGANGSTVVLQRLVL